MVLTWAEEVKTKTAGAAEIVPKLPQPVLLPAPVQQAYLNSTPSGELGYVAKVRSSLLLWN